MKYCVPYFRYFKYAKEVDEIIIPFNESLDIIKRFIEEKEIQSRIILEVDDSDMFSENFNDYLPILKNLSGYDSAICFSQYHKEFKNIYSELKDNNIKFFFKTFVRDWDTFHGLINVGVSDIYIVENLGFELNLLGPVAHASEVSIRVFANVCQSSWSENNPIKSFFNRPEDVYLYEPYVDVIEFFGTEKHEQEVMYKVYAKDKKWFGDLSEIIIGLNMELDSRCLVAAFAPTRIKCGKKCIKGKPCNICDRIIELSQTLQENDIMITH